MLGVESYGGYCVCVWAYVWTYVCAELYASESVTWSVYIRQFDVVHVLQVVCTLHIRIHLRNILYGSSIFLKTSSALANQQNKETSSILITSLIK